MSVVTSATGMFLTQAHVELTTLLISRLPLCAAFAAVDPLLNNQLLALIPAMELVMSVVMDVTGTLPTQALADHTIPQISVLVICAALAVEEKVVHLKSQNGTLISTTTRLRDTLKNSKLHTELTTKEWLTSLPDGKLHDTNLTPTTGTRSSSQFLLRVRNSTRKLSVLLSPGSLKAPKSRDSHLLTSSQKSENGCSRTTTQKAEPSLSSSEWKKCQ